MTGAQHALEDYRCQLDLYFSEGQVDQIFGKMDRIYPWMDMRDKVRLTGVIVKWADQGAEWFDILDRIETKKAWV